MKNHGLWMVIACAVPLLLIFMLPAFGIRKEVTTLLFIVVMVTAHLFMLRRHNEPAKKDKKGDEEHGCHQRKKFGLVKTNEPH